MRARSIEKSQNTCRHIIARSSAIEALTEGTILWTFYLAANLPFGVLESWVFWEGGVNRYPDLNSSRNSVVVLYSRCVGNIWVGLRLLEPGRSFRARNGYLHSWRASCRWESPVIFILWILANRRSFWGSAGAFIPCTFRKLWIICRLLRTDLRFLATSRYWSSRCWYPVMSLADSDWGGGSWIRLKLLKEEGGWHGVSSANRVSPLIYLATSSGVLSDCLPICLLTLILSCWCSLQTCPFGIMKWWDPIWVGKG